MNARLFAISLAAGLLISSVYSHDNSYTTSTKTKLLSGFCFAVPAAAAGAVLFHAPTQNFADKLLYYGGGTLIAGCVGLLGYAVVNCFTPEGRFARASGYVECAKKDTFVASLKNAQQSNIVCQVEDVWLNSEFPLADAFDALNEHRSCLISAQELFAKVIASESIESLISLSRAYLKEIPPMLSLIESAMKEIKTAPGYLAQSGAKNEKLIRIAQQDLARAAWLLALTSR